MAARPSRPPAEAVEAEVSFAPGPCCCQTGRWWSVRAIADDRKTKKTSSFRESVPYVVYEEQRSKGEDAKYIYTSINGSSRSSQIWFC